MPHPSLVGVLHYVRTLVGLPHADQLGDATLLHRFATHHDEAALVSLLQRHGPLVLATCRQNLTDDHAAEDAFQATFLVLAKKAATLHVHESLAPWLHRVALRAAFKVRTAASRRQVHEEIAVMRKTEPSDQTADWQPVLYEEIDRLPQKFRTPVVLCYLQGHTQEQAAQELAWPLTTLRGRLSQARDLLHRRLVRRGITAGAGVLTVGGSEGLAAVPPALLGATARTATVFAEGNIVSASAAAVATAVLQDLARVRTRCFVALLLLTIVTISASAGAVALHMLRKHPPAPPSAADVAFGDAPTERRPRPDALGDPLPDGAVGRLGTTRLRSRNFVFSPDCKHLACVDGTGRIHLWDALQGQELRRFGRGSTGVCFVPDGRRLVATDPEGFQVWDWTTGKELRRVPAKGFYSYGYTPAVLSPDGTILAIAEYTNGDATGEKQLTSTIHLYSVATGQELRGLRRLDVHPPESMAFSPDGRALAAVFAEMGEAGALERKLYVWDLTAEKAPRLLKTLRGRGVITFAPDGKRAVFADHHTDDQACFVDVASGQEVRTLRLGGTRGNLVFSPDGRLLASGSEAGRGSMAVWDMATGTKQFTFGEPGQSVSFSPDGRRLVAAGFGQIQTFDAADGRRTQQVQFGDHAPVHAAAFSADGKAIVSVQGRFVRWWDTDTGKETHHWGLAWARDSPLAALTPDGKWLAIADKNYRTADQAPALRVLDAATGKERRAFEGLPTRTDTVAISVDGAFVAALGDGAFVWEAASGKQVRAFAWEHHTVGLLAFSPDGRTLTAANEDKILVGEIATGQERRFRVDEATARLWSEGVNIACGLVFSPDGKALATPFPGPDFSIRLWEVGSGKQRYRFQGPECMSWATGFSPGGMMLATGSDDCRVRLWDPWSLRPCRALPGHEGSIEGVVFSPDGRRVASWSADTSILIWDVSAPGEPAPLRSAELSTQQLQGLWADLANPDAGRAYRSMCTLVSAERQSVPYLEKSLKPVVEPEPERLSRLLRDLDGADFEVRQRAEAELAQLAELGAADIRKALGERPPLEVRRRLEQLLDKVRKDEWTVERLQGMRALEVLEHIGTPEAKQLLENLAGGAEGARLTREAKASLERLAKRPSR